MNDNPNATADYILDNFIDKDIADHFRSLEPSESEKRTLGSDNYDMWSYDIPMEIQKIRLMQELITAMRELKTEINNRNNNT